MAEKQKATNIPKKDLSKDDPSWAFVPSALISQMELERVVITPPVPATAPGINSYRPLGERLVNAAARIGTAIARGGPNLIALLTPMNSGPEGTGNLFGGPGALYPPGAEPPPVETQPDPEPMPEPLPELDPVYVTPPPKPPVTIPIGSDPIMPPNWNDLSNPGGLDFGKPGPGIPLIPFPVPGDSVGDQPTPEPLGDPGELPLPSGPVVFPDIGPDTGSEPSDPTEPVANPVLPSPIGVPDPFGVGSPFFDPVQVPAPGTGTRPGTRTPTSPFTPPLLTPAFPGFPSPIDNPRPSLPPTIGLPDFFTDPTPSLLEDPIGDRFDGNQTPSDACSCDKKPKKKKAKRKDRTVCKQGTYTQKAKGIKYTPRRTVPCDEPVTPAKKAKKAKSSKPKARRYPTSLPDLLDSPF